MDLAKLREKLSQGQPTIGTWQQLPSPDVAEIMAKSGYDWIALDMEHGSIGIDILPNLVRAIECGGALPFARLPEANRVWIKAALEAGCKGLIFPMIESARQLEQAIDLATYPCQDWWRQAGSAAPAYRGVGFCRANDFGKHFEEYREGTAPKIFIVAQIEHIAAVDCLEEILAHKRLDAIMVGPYDLSGSMGLTGKFSDSRFQAAMTKISHACKKFGCRMGLHIVEPDPAALKMEIDRGCQFIAYGIDALFLWKSASRPNPEN